MFLKIFFPSLIFFWLGLFPSSGYFPSKNFLKSGYLKGDENRPFDFLPAHTDSDELVKHTAFMRCYSEPCEEAKGAAYCLTAEMCNNNGEERINNFRVDKDVVTGSAKP